MLCGPMDCPVPDINLLPAGSRDSVQPTQQQQQLRSDRACHTFPLHQTSSPTSNCCTR
ncbi:hypothetical protein BP00DRAFT_234777 [Aspergillus indologenus CBS 114.80]|uniref:Uncharacterized protein n=1 Tax=Aspergillus indologenus CBS 114.80 TaxID=1450541 RepID=A0A2V5IMZ8_9EURO|nr:hypothetical protein BP00DRAFT_234777 [Aspergillus indologenus CBS 114.80]